MKTPTPCPTGHYCPASASSTTQCPAGTFNNVEKATDVADCTACLPGKYCTIGSSAPTGDCLAGYYCRASAEVDSPTGSATNFGVCPAGHYCPLGTGDPIQCPPGTYNTLTQQVDNTACLTCPAGRYCDQPGMSTNGNPCPVGYYCPAGTNVQFPTTFCAAGEFCIEGSSAIDTCPAGTYQNAPRKGFCIQCPKGYTCLAGATAFAASPCSAGKYCVAGSSTEVDCPAGTYNPSQKMGALSDCIDCDPGSYCDSAGLTAVTGDCDQGYFCTLASTTATPATLDATGGPCTDGHYCETGSTVELPCPPTQYCSGPNLAAPSGLCDAGYFCSGGANVSTPASAAEGGGPCPAGNYCPQGTSSPNPCPPGTFNALTHQTHIDNCTICPGGSYCQSFGGTAVTGTCEVGYFCPAGSTVAKQNICPAGNECPAGSSAATPCTDPNYQDIKGQGSCKVCGAGYECTDTTRTLCRPDQSSQSYYCPDNAYSRVLCPDGQFTNIIGAETAADCVDCPPGFYCPNSLSSAKIVECPSGFYCDGQAYTADGSGTGTYTCTDGHYCPSGSSHPIPCTPGSYCAGTGLQAPTGDCDQGYYCLEGSNTATPTGGAVGDQCPAGSYCPTGSAINIECPVDTYNPAVGGIDSTACQACDAGKRCLSRGMSAVGDDCPAGYYCTQSPFEQRPCEEGNYCPAGQSAQILCPSGEYQPYTLQSSCLACPEGYYCPQSDTTTKFICPAGQYCVANTETPVDCPAGTYGPREGLINLAGCENCPHGKYCGTAGLSSPGSDCTAGYYCVRGATSATETICPVGHYCPQGTYTPIHCPPGTYRDTTGASVIGDCADCPTGKYCPDMATTAAPTTGNDCAPGYQCNTGARTQYPLDGVTGKLCDLGNTCAICPSGSYNAKFGIPACVNCPKGYYCDNSISETEFFICPAGKYCPEGDTTNDVVNLYDCPAGTYSSNTGLHDASECTPCDPGRYCDAGSTSVSGSCNSGYVCPRGADRADPTGTFGFDPTDTATYNVPGPCPIGHYCPVGSSYPVPCPEGTYQTATGQAVCLDCPAGRYCDETGISTAADLAAKLCAAGHFCSGGTKVEKPIRTTHSGSICSSGKFCEQGDAVENPCPGGTYDRRKGIDACMKCPNGYYCPVGSTVPIVCPAGQYCPQQNATHGSETPIDCPDGTYNTEDGLESSAQCRPCPVSKYCTGGAVQGSCSSGFFCDTGAISATDPSKTCPRNHYCEAGTSAPVRCESGKIFDGDGGNSPANCTDCPAGQYCPETNNGYSIDCPAGFYCTSGQTAPTACPSGTFRAAVNATAKTDCIDCNAGVLCNVEGVGDETQFQCPVGHYCVAGSKTAAECPAGRYRNTVGAGADTDCPTCPDGFYCPKGTINPIPCPAATTCPAGSNETTVCPAGYYCPPETGAPLDCPVAYYCPQGSEQYLKCANGTYCEINSIEPTLCPNGTFGNGNPNNYNSDVSCVPCSAGTYSTTDQPGFCFPCTAGYVCLGRTLSATPQVRDTDNGYPCPKGYYCPEGSTKETA